MHKYLTRLRLAPAWAYKTLVALFIITIIECGIFNLPHWRSISNTSATSNISLINDSRATLGKGLVRLDGGGLLVANPAQAYIDTQVNQAINYVQILAIQDFKVQPPQLKKEVRNKMHVRLEVKEKHSNQWLQAGSTTLSPGNPTSLYVKNRSASGPAQKLRLWISEDSLSMMGIQGLVVNPPIPFSLNPVRVLIMAVIAAAIIALSPRSNLWQIQLNTSSRKQRGAFWAFMLTLVIWCGSVLVMQINGFTVRDYHEPASYTYDFNQYGHLADAFLNKQPWLNLPVPEELNTINPYDVYARERLLSSGIEPIFWDHVFYDGHWYSYFGPLPALLLFAPYRYITSLFVPGGLMLPTPAACSILIAGFAITFTLLIIRLLKRFLPTVSIAGTIIALLTFAAGSQIIYLCMRTNFYTVPFDASLLLASLGLWFWLGARRVNNREQRSHVWTIADHPTDRHLNAYSNPRVYLSLPHVIAGALSISACLGCRQTFVLCFLLIIPIFFDEMVMMLTSLNIRHTTDTIQLAKKSRFSRANTMRIVGAAIIPVILITTPILAYNKWRFGSPLDFGNTYQITVVDLNTYKPPWHNLAYLVFYYLFLPLTPLSSFPYLQTSPSPLPIWQYTEPGLGGLFVLAPVLLVGIAFLALPSIRHKLKVTKIQLFVLSTLTLSAAILLINSYIAGFDARYMLDFSWLLALVAIVPLTVCTDSKASPKNKYLYLIRLVVLIATMLTIGFAMLTGITLLNTENTYLGMEAWFSVL